MCYIGPGYNSNNINSHWGEEQSKKIVECNGMFEHGQFSRKYSQYTLLSWPAKASYEVSIMNSKSQSYSISGAVMLCVMSLILSHAITYIGPCYNMLYWITLYQDPILSWVTEWWWDFYVIGCTSSTLSIAPSNIIDHRVMRFMPVGSRTSTENSHLINKLVRLQ